MDAQEQIDRFQEFFESNYYEILLDKAARSEDFLSVEFSTLSRFDLDLAESLLEQPEDSLKAAEYAISKFDLGVEDFRITVRFSDLPESSTYKIRNVRSKHINKFFQFTGIVRQKSDVRPQVTNAKFECPSCGNIINILQVDTKFREPSGCSCGRKGKFHLVSKDLVDAQKLVIEESPEDLDGGEQPKRINVFLKNDLVSPMSEKKTNPGSKIKLTGILREVPIVLATGGKSTRYDLMVEANYLQPVQEEFTTLTISPEDKEEIITLSKDPAIYEKLISSLAPSIYGHERIKEALLLQLLGGQSKTQEDGVRRRGDIHVLLIGDPGSGKCLHGNTKIILQTGEIKNIKNIVDAKEIFGEYSSSKIYLPSMQFDGFLKTGLATKVWARRTNEKLLKILLRSGKELLLTKNHPLFTNKEGFIIAKSAENFGKNEYVATPRQINIEGALQFLEKFSPKKYSNNSKEYNYPLIVNSILSRILGYLCGDGCLRYTDTSGQISFVNQEKDVLKNYEQSFNELFHTKLSIRSKKGTSAKECYVVSKAMIDFMKKEFSEIATKTIEKTIPEKILKSPNNILSEFIKGLFECDAHVNMTKRQIEYSTISEDLVEKLQISLLRFGIVSFVKKKIKFATNTKAKRKVLSFELVFSGEFLKKYYEKIGFVSKRKSDALKKAIIGKNNTNVDIVPGISHLLKNIRENFGLKQKEMGLKRSTYAHYEQENRLPSVRSLKKILNELQRKKYGGAQISLLRQLISADIFWDKIIAIEEINNEEKYVYDFEIDNTHNFVANGVVVHNSQLLKRISVVAPKARFVSGKGASGAGLTAAVVRDEFLRGWALEAGALVLANKGIVCIDELDKMSKEDTSAMHEALEQQSVSISKANIQATLRSETTVLAAANPKFGRFDPYELLFKQIELPSTLINRFDLIFPVKDLPNQETDDKLASFILKMHQGDTNQNTPIDTESLTKYLGYAKRTADPVLTEPALNEIKNYFVSMRNSGNADDKIQTIPISARQLEGLVRLAEASAKTRLSNKVTKKDAQRAIDLLHHCLSLIGLDAETGKFDIDRIATGITATQRGNISKIKEIIAELEKAFGKQIKVEDLLREAEIKGIPEDATTEVVEKLKRAGDLFSPKHGYISKI